VTRRDNGFLFLDHVLLDPGQEVGDFGEDSGESLAFAVAPRNDADNVEKALLVAADQRTARVSHAGGDGVSAEADHARLDHISPGALQSSVAQDRAVGFLELRGRENTTGDSLHGETPAGEPAVLSAVVVVGLLRHAGQSSVRSTQVNFSLQLDQSNVVLNLMRFVEVFVDNDLLNIEGHLRSVTAEDVPFTSLDRVFGRSFGLHEAMSSAENPVLGNQSTTANVLFGDEEEGRVLEGDLPREFAMGSILTTDNTAAGSLLSALLKGNGRAHEGGQYHEHFHNVLCAEM